MLEISLIAGLLIPSVIACAQDYKNPKLPIEKRVSDLIGRMKLDEKVAQFRSMHAGRPAVNDQ